MSGAGQTADVPLTPASGTQIRLRHETMAATLTEVGAGLRELSVGGRPLIQSYGEGDIATYAHGQVLAPWPNRVAGGTYEFAGSRHQLGLTEPDPGNAIHGLARWVPWLIAAHEPDRALFVLTVHPQAGYPFALALSVEYRLTGDGLHVTTSARNVGSEPLPFGCGFHPYLTLGTPTLDTARLSLPADTRLVADDAGIPTGERLPVEGTQWDFRASRPIGDLRFDTAFTDLRRNAAGRFEVALHAPDGDGVVLWADAAYGYVMAFTGDGLPAELERRGLAVEPMSCAPNAFRSGEGLTVLAPGDRWRGVWGLRPA